jgi:NADH-quinone oxidoreductase subunit M
MPHHLSLVLAAPAAGALLLLAVPAVRPGVARAVSIAASALAFALVVPLWFRFEPRGPQWQFAERFDVGGLVARFDVGLDGFGLSLAVVTALVAFALAVAAALARTDRARSSGTALLAIETGALGVFVSVDLLQMFVFWQLAVAALLATIWLTQSRRAFLLSSVIAIAGAVTMLAGIFALRGYYQTLVPASAAGFDLRVYLGLPLPSPVETRVFLLLAAGFVSPLALLLVHAWSSVRRASPLPVLLLSAMLASLALFGIVRVLQPVTPAATRAFSTAIVTAGIIAALAAALAALRRTDFRTSVFWIGACHVSLAVAGAFAGSPGALTGSTVHALAHSLAIASLLVVAGVFVADGSESVDIAFPAGFITAATLLSGVVVSGGLTGSRMIVSGLADVGAGAQAAAGLAILVSAVALAAAVRRALSGATQPASVGIAGPGFAPIIMLAALSVLIAVYPSPLLARLETSVARVVMRVSPQYAPQVADCLNQPAPPPPPDSGLPAGMMLAAPCADGSSKPQDPAKP